MPAAINTSEFDNLVAPAFAPHEIADMQPVIDAVCLELGVTAREKARRKAVAERVMAAYSRGSRHPLNMVQAGLSEQSIA